MENLYDIYFAGNLVEGVSQEQARSNVGALFKADEKTLDALFSGKAQLLKKGIDKASAIKYKAAMHKAGAMITVRAHRAETTTDTTTASNPQPQSKSQPVKTASLADSNHLSLAPAGSDVLTEDERHVIDALEIDTSNLQMESPFSEPEIDTTPPPPAPDTSHISIAPVGEDIPHLESNQVLVEPDISNISSSPEGTDFSDCHGDDLPIMEPDITGISIAPSGSDLIEDEYKKPDPPPPPSTDHLQLESEKSGKADFGNKPRVIV